MFFFFFFCGFFLKINYFYISLERLYSWNLLKNSFFVQKFLFLNLVYRLVKPKWVYTLFYIIFQGIPTWYLWGLLLINIWRQCFMYGPPSSIFLFMLFSDLLFAWSLKMFASQLNVNIVISVENKNGGSQSSRPVIAGNYWNSWHGSSMTCDACNVLN